jgi:carbon starvation protein
MAATGSQGTLWPMFGAANQLIAALALIVVTAYFIKEGRSAKFTFIPAMFMLLTACGALLWKGYAYLTSDTPNYTLAFASVVLLILAVFVGLQGTAAVRKTVKDADTVPVNRPEKPIQQTS